MCRDYPGRGWLGGSFPGSRGVKAIEGRLNSRFSSLLAEAGSLQECLLPYLAPIPAPQTVEAGKRTNGASLHPEPFRGLNRVSVRGSEKRWTPGDGRVASTGQACVRPRLGSPGLGQLHTWPSFCFGCTWRCSGITPDAALKNQSWQYTGNHIDVGN